MNADDGPKATMKRLGTFVRSNHVEIVLALVILLALAGTGMRLYQQTIDAVFLGLLVVAIGGAVVARYLPDLMRRITKIGPGGVELSTLTSPDPPVDRLLTYPVLESRNIRDPFGKRTLNSEERWIYEQLSAVFLQLELARVDPSDLKDSALENYRRIVTRLGSLAILNGDYEKTISVMKDFEGLSTARGDELFLLGTAYADRGEQLALRKWTRPTR